MTRITRTKVARVCRPLCQAVEDAAIVFTPAAGLQSTEPE
jgi:hypothetical protein